VILSTYGGITTSLGIGVTTTPPVRSRKKDGVLELERNRFEALKAMHLQELELVEQRLMREVCNVFPSEIPRLVSAVGMLSHHPGLPPQAEIAHALRMEELASKEKELAFREKDLVLGHEVMQTVLMIVKRCVRVVVPHTCHSPFIRLTILLHIAACARDGWYCLSALPPALYMLLYCWDCPFCCSSMGHHAKRRRKHRDDTDGSDPSSI
jgi:hypothetical protein